MDRYCRAEYWEKRAAEAEENVLDLLEVLQKIVFAVNTNITSEKVPDAILEEVSKASKLMEEVKNRKSLD